MAMSRWTPVNDLTSLHNAMDRLFSDVFGEALAPTQEEARAGAQPTLHLPVNVRQDDSGYHIEAPVPGFRPEDVEVTFADGLLTINARRREERERKEGNYLRREAAFGNLWRQVALPGDVQADQIRASFDNGMLTVDVPRARRPQPKKIEVQAGRQMAGAGKKS
jgi:HSP20 family protein